MSEKLGERKSATVQYNQYLEMDSELMEGECLFVP